MPICRNCNQRFPYKTILDNKEIDLRRRRYCLDCNPYGSRNFWGGKKVAQKTIDGKRKRKLSKREFICSKCGTKRFQCTRNKVCSSCRNKEKRHEQRSKAIENLGGKCKLCSYKKSINALDFHHVDESRKKFALSTAWQKSWEVIEEEIKKCVLLCRNCHTEVHEGISICPGIPTGRGVAVRTQ